MIITVERKDSGPAKTPAELANEISEFNNSLASTVRKHAEQLAWLNRNKLHVLHSFGTETGRNRRRAKALFVVSETLIGVHIQGVPTEVLTFSDVQVRLASEGLQRAYLDLGPTRSSNRGLQGTRQGILQAPWLTLGRGVLNLACQDSR